MPIQNSHRRRQLIALAIMGVMLWTGVARATTLLSMSIDQVVNDAELIFEGRVVDQRIQQDPATGLIYTYVSFAITDIVKGSFTESELELRFTGGSANGEIIEVPGLAVPQLGEEGIYFVASVSRKLVNPLLGWSQGHYVIAEEDGERRIQSNAGQAVMAVQSAATVPALIQRPQQLIDGKSDTATGVVTNASAVSLERAMSVNEFKTRIREILQP